MPLWLIALVVTMFIVAARLHGEPSSQFARILLSVILIVLAVIILLGHLGVMPSEV